MMTRSEIPGLLVAMGVLIMAWGSSLAFSGDLVLHSLLLGFLMGQIFKVPDQLSPGLRYGEKFILNLAIVLMGAGLSIGQMGKLGWGSLLIICVSIGSVFLSALLVGRITTLTKNFVILSATGNAICGASAIAAVAPILKARKEEVGVSIGIVNSLGSVWMFAFPLLLINFEGLNTEEMSQWIGATLQAVGHVSGAGYAVSDEVGKFAVAIKLGRVILLGPLLLIIGVIFRDATQRKLQLPWFITGFFILMLSRSIVDWSADVLVQVALVSKVLLALAMGCIGWNIQWADIRASGLSAICFNLGISIIQILTVGGCIALLHF